MDQDVNKILIADPFYPLAYDPIPEQTEDVVGQMISKLNYCDFYQFGNFCLESDQTQPVIVGCVFI
jgi:hypothetical protein